jgi:hypothetical protein
MIECYERIKEANAVSHQLSRRTMVQGQSEQKVSETLFSANKARHVGACL